MRRRQSACPAGREQFSLPVVWGSPARWRVQGRSDGIFRRNCSQSPQAEGKQCPQTRRNPTGSRLRTSSRTWASACKCKWPTPKTTSHMESGLKFEPVVTACGPGGMSEVMPSLFFTYDTFFAEGNLPNQLSSHGEGYFCMWKTCYLDQIFIEFDRNLLQVCFY